MGNTYSEGSRTGRLTKITQSGFFWKTWEGEMISDGLRTRGTEHGAVAIANTWNFSIDAKTERGENIEELVGTLQNKLENGENVTVKYWAPYIAFPCRGASDYYVHNVS